MAEEKLIDNETLNELRTRFEKILVPENGYAAVMDDTVLPYLQKRRTDRQLTVAPGKELHIVRYSAWPDVKDGSVKGTVIIVHGFTESAEKYREFAYYLLNFGYDVVLYDQRGHGLSSRDVEDMQLTHIDKFETYVSDLGAVVEAGLGRGRQGPLRREGLQQPEDIRRGYWHERTRQLLQHRAGKGPGRVPQGEQEHHPQHHQRSRIIYCCLMTFAKSSLE